MHHILDNPAWHALQTTHRPSSIGTLSLRRYLPNLLQIIAFQDAASAPLNELAPFMTNDEKCFIVGELPPLPDNWSLHRTIECIQMVCEKPVKMTFEDLQPIIRLDVPDRKEMFELVNLVQPGYFHENTPELGNYYGIRQDGALIAMVGERLKMTGYTEISAVCTHPDFTGRRLAQQLLTHIMKQNFAEGNIPFLHFVSTNIRAKNIYELLGFKERRMMPWHVVSMTK